MHRNSYDTSIKHLFRFGLHSAIPVELIDQIPRTQIHRWKNEESSKYVGCELNHIAKQEMDLLVSFPKSQSAKRLFRSYVRIAKTVQSFLDDKTLENILRSKKEKIVELADNVKNSISTKQFSKVLGISRSTLQNWKREVITKCDRSVLTMCFKRFPLQASINEVMKLKEVLTDKKFQYWPISSIAPYCRREGILFFSDSTWYKYARLLNLKRQIPASRRKKNKRGIRATTSDEIWHADVSIFKINNVKYYIYSVVDNYSRRILASKVSEKLSATIRVQTIRLAYEKAILYREKLNIKLVVDGGSENNNSTKDHFIENSMFNVHKLIALRDIHFSNSMVEAHFSILKYNYLYKMKINCLEDLAKATEFAENDFNAIRPQTSLNGATPDEVYFKQHIPSKNLFSEQMKLARNQRIAENKAIECVKF